MKPQRRAAKLERRQKAYDSTNLSIRDRAHMTRRPGSLKK